MMKEQPINLYQNDCMEVMGEKPDGYYDLAIVDPPYGLNEGMSKRSKSGLRNPRHSKTGSKKYSVRVGNYTLKKWDEARPGQEYFDELFRVAKHQIIWGVNHFNEIIFPGSGRIFWDKMMQGDFSDGELAFCSLHSRVVRVVYMWNGMMQGRSIKEGHIQQGNKELCEKRIHPTQKPVLLYKWLLKQYARKGFRIIDTHGGSGSILLAIHDFGFEIDWCEKDEEYFLAAKARFENYSSQQRLILPDS